MAMVNEDAQEHAYGMENSRAVKRTTRGDGPKMATISQEGTKPNSQEMVLNKEKKP
jgi:hypothetical protein